MKKKLKNKLIAQIVDYMDINELSVEKMSKKIGVSYLALLLWLNGRRKPNRISQLKIIKLFHKEKNNEKK